MAEYIKSERSDEKDCIKEPNFVRAAFIQQNICPGCKFKNPYSGCEGIRIPFVEEGGTAPISTLADDKFRSNIQSKAPCLH
jgi:hypothetical protein